MMKITVKLYPSRKDLDLQLQIPDKEIECPILQESIQTAVFESFPRPFSKAHPQHKAVVLGCSHTFHAMALVYHWSRNRNVLCPICRAGPSGQRLVMNRLPEDWRYSLSSKVRREKRMDREEAQQENLRIATLLSNELLLTTSTVPRTVVSFVIYIEIQALTHNNSFVTWKLNTTISPSINTVVFEVPVEELHTIPFDVGTLMRFIPFASSTFLMTMITPSEWFESGRSIGILSTNFQIEYHDESRRFKTIKLVLQEEEFSGIIVNAYLAANGF